MNLLNNSTPFYYHFLGFFWIMVFQILTIVVEIIMFSCLWTLKFKEGEKLDEQKGLKYGVEFVIVANVVTAIMGAFIYFFILGGSV